MLKQSHDFLSGEFFVYKLSKGKTIRKLRVSMPEAVKELGEKTTYYSYAPKYKKITKYGIVNKVTTSPL